MKKKSEIFSWVLKKNTPRVTAAFKFYLNEFIILFDLIRWYNATECDIQILILDILFFEHGNLNTYTLNGMVQCTDTHAMHQSI